MGERGGGENLRGLEGGEIVIRIYCIKNLFLIKNEKKSGKWNRSAEVITSCPRPEILAHQVYENSETKENMDGNVSFLTLTSFIVLRYSVQLQSRDGYPSCNLQ